MAISLQYVKVDLTAPGTINCVSTTTKPWNLFDNESSSLGLRKTDLLWTQQAHKLLNIPYRQWRTSSQKDFISRLINIERQRSTSLCVVKSLQWRSGWKKKSEPPTVSARALSCSGGCVFVCVSTCMFCPLFFTLVWNSSSLLTRSESIRSVLHEPQSTGMWKLQSQHKWRASDRTQIKAQPCQSGEWRVRVCICAKTTDYDANSCRGRGKVCILRTGRVKLGRCHRKHLRKTPDFLHLCTVSIITASGENVMNAEQIWFIDVAPSQGG